VSIVLFVSSSRASSLSIVCSLHHVFKLYAMYIVFLLVGVILCRLNRYSMLESHAMFLFTVFVVYIQSIRNGIDVAGQLIYIRTTYTLQ
jgi:hypothetical protein